MDDRFEYFQYLFMDKKIVWGFQVLGSKKCAMYCAAYIFAYTRGMHSIVKFGENVHYVTLLLLPCFVYVYTVSVIMLCRGTNIAFWISME